LFHEIETKALHGHIKQNNISLIKISGHTVIRTRYVPEDFRFWLEPKLAGNEKNPSEIGVKSHISRLNFIIGFAVLILFKMRSDRCTL